MILYRKKCVICLDDLKNIHVEKKIPLKLACIDKVIKDKTDLSISQCNKCNTIQLDKLIPLDILYSESHNFNSVGNTWKEYFELFQKELHILIQNKNILEIGDPSGKLANTLDGYLKWFIVEPNKNPNIVFKDNIIFIEKIFDNKLNVDNEIDLIVHSHLFEHIYEPNEFLKKCFEILSENGEMIFGVPDMEYIANNELAPFLGLFFEHTIFLNKENITYMLNNNGFEIIKILDYKNHSNIYHVKKNININKTNLVMYDYKIKLFDTLQKYRSSITFYNNIIIQNKNIDIYIFGASYNTQFLLAMGLEWKKLKGILDNSIDKNNKIFYGFDLKIYHPVVLKNKNITLIIPNSSYKKEITKQILTVNNNINII